MPIAIGERAATAGFDVEAHLARIEADGFTVIDDLLDAATVQAVKDGLAPLLDVYRGRNSFEGVSTERIYTLVARGRVFEDITEEPRLMALLDRMLMPNYLLTASQAIRIYPGEAAQRLHTDDSFYRVPRPRPAIGVTMICAIDAFTAENGATMIVPGSHKWGELGEEGEQRRGAVEARPLVMPAGACAVLAGTLVHGGGANRSDRPRLALINQYCEPWARPQENYFLGIPREMVREMSPKVQSLLGYAMNGTIMGQVTGRHPLKALADDFVPSVATEPRAV